MTKEVTENRFDEKFKGWILQDDQENYRNFEIIKAFIQSEIDLALANRNKEIVDKLVSYFDKKHYCLDSECKINKEQSEIINLITKDNE